MNLSPDKKTTFAISKYLETQFNNKKMGIAELNKEQSLKGLEELCEFLNIKVYEDEVSLPDEQFFSLCIQRYYLDLVLDKILEKPVEEYLNNSASTRGLATELIFFIKSRAYNDFLDRYRELGIFGNLLDEDGKIIENLQ